MDPHYFERTWLLIPNNSEKTYALLRKLLEKTGLAAIGKVTMSTKERVVVIHSYQNAIVATTLRYPDEVKDPSHFAEPKYLLMGWRRGAGPDDEDSGQDDDGPGPQRIP